MLGIGRMIAFFRRPSDKPRPRHIAEITLEAVDVTEEEEKKPRKLQPAIRAAHLPDPIVKSPRQHAKELLERLICMGVEGPLRPEELRDYYVDMIIDYYWLDHPWNVIAREFTKLTTKKKKYTWVRDGRTGKRHKLRVYPIPTREQSQRPHLRRVA